MIRNQLNRFLIVKQSFFPYENAGEDETLRNYLRDTRLQKVIRDIDSIVDDVERERFLETKMTFDLDFRDFLSKMMQKVESK